jgi:hypothetical protein
MASIPVAATGAGARPGPSCRALDEVHADLQLTGNFSVVSRRGTASAGLTTTPGTTASITDVTSAVSGVMSAIDQSARFFRSAHGVGAGAGAGAGDVGTSSDPWASYGSAPAAPGSALVPFGQSSGGGPLGPSGLDIGDLWSSTLRSHMGVTPASMPPVSASPAGIQFNGKW